MSTDPIERLTSIFEHFPGIGPRQAQRFVQYLLRAPSSIRRELVDSVENLTQSVRQCPTCYRYHAASTPECSICSKSTRDTSILAVVATDTDLFALERSGTYNGMYFVLGGTISLASEKMKGLRVEQLKKIVASRKGLDEVVLAFPANPEGDATAIRIAEELREAAIVGPKVTMLGRGLSTGSELEYADPETLKNAFENRK